MTSPKGAQLAKEVGVAPETLNQWADEFQIPLPERYQRNALRVLKMVKELKDKNCGFNTIQRHIQLDYPELKSPVEDLVSGMKLEDNKDDLHSHFNTHRTELLELGELAEKYAQANYNIGQMSMQMRQLEEENHRLRAQLKLLPSPAAWEAMKEQELSYKRMLESLQQRVNSLEEQRQSPGEKLRSLPELPAAPNKAQLKLPFAD